ncbi:MAG: hypothetical protein JST36_04250 [Bacteroidetes bacterium]|nr:hypothetical protein [Bacteroidota bacterium]
MPEAIQQDPRTGWLRTSPYRTNATALGNRLDITFLVIARRHDEAIQPLYTPVPVIARRHDEAIQPFVFRYSVTTFLLSGLLRLRFAMTELVRHPCSKVRHCEVFA